MKSQHTGEPDHGRRAGSLHQAPEVNYIEAIHSDPAVNLIEAIRLLSQMVAWPVAAACTFANGTGVPRS